MNRYITTLLLTSGISLFPVALSGQTLNSILSKLQAVEVRLNELDNDAQEEFTERLESVEHRITILDTEQKKELLKIQKSIGELKEHSSNQTVSHEVFSQSIEPVADRIEGLELELANLKQSLSSNERQSLGLLVADLNGLLGELKSALDVPGFHETLSHQNAPLPEGHVVEISGFGDLFYSFGDTESQDSHINIGQVELGLETAVTDHIGFAGALVYEAHEEAFGLGDLFLDFNLIGHDGQFLSVGGIESGGIMVGKFDIPFGIDFHEYPSIDRKLISGPLVVEHTHEEWGDFGLQLYGEGQQYVIALYGVNGFEYESASHDLVEPKFSAGGRIGLKPTETIEIGGSYAGFLNSDTVNDMVFAGIDAQVSLAALSLKGEYIEHETGLASDEKATAYGYYCQGLYDFGQYFTVARYGVFVPYGSLAIYRTSAGLGYVVREGLEFRVEHQRNSTETNHTFFQMVLGI